MCPALDFKFHDKICSNLNHVELPEHPAVVFLIVGGRSDLLFAAVTCASTTEWALFLVFFGCMSTGKYTGAKNMNLVKQLAGWLDVLLFFDVP